MEKIYDYINSYSFSNWIFLIIGIFLSYFGYIILKRVLNLLINKIILKSRNQWDNIIFNKRLIDTLSLLIPIMIIYLLLPLFPVRILSRPLPVAVVFPEPVRVKFSKLLEVV